MPGADAPLPARRLTPLLSPVLVDAETTLTDKAPHDTVSFRDLWRCYDRKLPTGQACARQLRDILPQGAPLMTLKGPDIDPGETLDTYQFVEPLTAAIAKFNWFRTDTPLTYYLAQEAYLHGNEGRTFGPLGSYIMASTFRRALNTTLGSGGTEDGEKTFSYAAPHGVFTMPQFIGLLTLPDKALTEEIKATIPDSKISKELL
jgi:hypothetical protein